MLPAISALESAHDEELISQDASDEYPNEESEQKDVKYQSRSEILEAFEDLGVDISAFDSLSIEDLNNLLNNLRNLVDVHRFQKKPGRPKNNEQSALLLSSSDKKILHHLFSSQGRTSSQSLSKALDIPISTIQRRRKRLETNLIERRYVIRAEKLGWRTASLFISIVNGRTTEVGKEILKTSNMVTTVTRVLGENVMDLRADVLFKTNMELVSFIELIKSIEGVKNVIWGESLEMIGKNDTFYETVINSSE